jgi:hypothetical protein
MKKLSTRLYLALTAALLLSGLVPLNQASAAVHPGGANVSNNGTVYMVTDNGQRRPYTSAAAFLSYGFNSWTAVSPATPEDLALPEGSFIPPRDGKIVCSDRGSDKGTCYLITDSKRAAFVSGQVFSELGFSFSQALYGDVSFLASADDINSSAEQHRSGVLINKNGTIYLVDFGSLLGIPSMDVLATWGYSLNDVVPANGSDASLSQNLVISPRQGAKLRPTEVSTDSGEDEWLKNYIESYPSLPAKEISSSADKDAVLDLIDLIDQIGSFAEAYPYLSGKSMELLNRVPELKSFLDDPANSGPSDATFTKAKVTVFEGKQFALYSATQRSGSTGSSSPIFVVFVKEDGAWKLDLVGTLKYYLQKYSG